MNEEKAQYKLVNLYYLEYTLPLSPYSRGKQGIEEPENL